MDEPSGKLCQVELNTIASSFSSLATLVSDFHRFRTFTFLTQNSTQHILRTLTSVSSQHVVAIGSRCAFISVEPVRKQIVSAWLTISINSKGCCGDGGAEERTQRIRSAMDRI